jgi:hypothetical protein
MNDEHFMTNATDDQRKVALTTSTPVAMLPALPPPPTPVSVEVCPQLTITDGDMKQQMVEGLATESGMNMQWAKKCLSERNWDTQPYMPSTN